jgi:predicted O-linked N-acetylglucosamine transferase (SPINDLY family)
VRFRLVGRAANASAAWDPAAAAAAAAAVNAEGVCVLIDLIGYTSDHRQARAPFDQYLTSI